MAAAFPRSAESLARRSALLRSRRRRQMRWMRRAAWLMSLPAILAFGLFGWYPMIMAFIVAFQHYTIVGPPQWVGLQNFRLLLHDTTALIALRNSFYYAFLTIVLTFWIPIIVSVLLMEVSERARRWIMILWFIPIPNVAAIVIWKYFYDPNFGLLASLWKFLGLPHFLWLDSPQWAMFLIVLPTIVMYGPGLIYISTLQSVPEDLYEAAELDGASFLRKVVSITLPTLRPIITVLLLLSVIANIQVFNQPYIMTGGGPIYATTTMVLYIFNTAFHAVNFGYADVLAIGTFVILMVLVTLQRRIIREGS